MPAKPASSRMRLPLAAAAAIGLAVVAAGALALAAWFMMTGPSPAYVRSDYEWAVGAEMARTLSRIAGDREERLAVVVLWRRGTQPYEERLAAFKEGLGDSITVADVFHPIDEGVYDDDDYVEAIEAALARAPEATILTLVSAAGVGHASVGPRLRAFLERKGRLFLVGEIIDAETPLAWLVGGENVWILARRRAAADGSNLDPSMSPEEYVETRFVLMGPDIGRAD